MSPENAPRLILQFGGNSDRGVKASNEDAFTALLPTEKSTRKYKGAAACIADGASCSSNAQLASQTAVTNFISDYFSTPDYWSVKQSAVKVIGAINSWLYQQRRQDLVRSDGYVTTFSAVIIKSHTAHVFHTGDSRVYLLRDGELEHLTQDHNYRRGDKNFLTRALGFEQNLELDYKSLRVQTGDRFMLTSDGVHDNIPPSELIELACGKTNDLEEIAKLITDVALHNGSEDNVSCLLVDVAELPIERIDEAFQQASLLAIPPILNPGNTLDHFEITHVLHSGTRSHVYRARDTRSDILRVIKVPSINCNDDPEYLESFAREQWIGRKLQHPQLMKIFSPPEGSQFLYHVCEFVQGKTLRQWMTDNPAPDLDQVRLLLDAMIVPLRALHRAKMVHRDIKPENFIINRDGVITLIDFGTMQIAGIDEISEAHVAQPALGDISYMAPEYMLHGSANQQSDLFSLAVIVYEMLSGQLPFKLPTSNSDTPKQIERWQYQPLSKRAIPSATTPLWIDSVLKKALAPKVEYRFQALSEFREEFTNPSPEMLRSVNLAPLIERHPLRFWQALSLVLALIILGQWILQSQ
ncbi:MAG: bifunctional protein-serine/threonine kinase/phosphatase [Gammaproteobacteria bacterium]|nr:bifunctional protein-serine/threonine kinase/phosphatase [Gammaproteobacteria bacterium]